MKKISHCHQDEKDYDERYDTLHTSRIETSFIEPTDATEAPSTLRLRQKIKQDKIVSLYRYLSVTGDPGLADLDQFMIRKNLKTVNIELLFLDGNNQWQSLTNKRTGEFLAAKITLERSVKAATKLKGELPTDLEMGGIPLEDLSSLAADIHVKTREASQDTTLDMREILAIGKTLQNIQGELLNNTSKLKGIDERIQRDRKK